MCSCVSVCMSRREHVARRGATTGTKITTETLSSSVVFSTDFITHKSFTLILRVAPMSVHDRKNTVVCRLARFSPPFHASSDTWRDRRWRKNWTESSVEFAISDPGQLLDKTAWVWHRCVWLLVIAATLTGKPASCGHGSLFSRVFGSEEWKQTGSFCLLPDT